MLRFAAPPNPKLTACAFQEHWNALVAPSRPPSAMTHPDSVLGIILAGGASRRFGADKSTARLGGRPLLAWVTERARPQVGLLLLNANDPEIGKAVADIE